MACISIYKICSMVNNIKYPQLTIYKHTIFTYLHLKWTIVCALQCSISFKLLVGAVGVTN
jgi:hypothetical protein